MQSLPKFGTSIGEVVFPTYQVYTPLLQKQAEVIKSTKRQTFTYGSHPRQQLDLYTPSNSEKGQDKLLIFLYGGGLVRGDKISPVVPQELVYANLGHFFAERVGCKVIIPDYRLISHEAKFPSGGEDLALVVQWAKENIKQDSKDPLDLYIMGNSAGGIHSATYLFASQFSESRRGILGSGAAELRLKGVILLAVPFHFDQAVAERAETLSSYYGTEVQQHSPLGLLRSSKEDGSVDGFKEVQFLVITASLDPKAEILVPNDDFVKEWPLGSNLAKLEIEGHNHISPVLSLGTGVEEEERWGQQVVDFIMKHSP
ncbi:hypothetical protein H2200_007045 [Cladophialophora chaetospira]|uniref:BD-FAE-like domain-containing protein n=1 Tax=Cladophialophora chaetospira TaxID=386627 RepID=A0AA38X729_9EURO|nr:hypothetical protein H2200_007045 [Cladophialophora chaetospira]